MQIGYRTVQEFINGIISDDIPVPDDARDHRVDSEFFADSSEIRLFGGDNPLFHIFCFTPLSHLTVSERDNPTSKIDPQLHSKWVRYGIPFMRGEAFTIFLRDYPSHLVDP